MTVSEKSAKGIAQAVSAAVRAGTLSPGEKLPPIRTAARDLGVAAPTVSAAWALLSRAGIIHTDGRRGTVVRAGFSGPRRYRRALDSGLRPHLDLSLGLPDPALLPDLRASMRRIDVTPTPNSYLDHPVLPELFDLLCEQWPFAAEQITVVDGAMDALSQIAVTHLRFGDVVAIEQPTFPPLLDLLESMGAVPVGVRYDAEGPVPADIDAAVRHGATAFVYQPRGQNPTGLSMSPERCAQLGAVLAGTSVTVIEDDSAGASIAGPSPSLGRLMPTQTIHVRSFSKSHGPDLRLAAVGGPAALIDPMIERRYLGQGWSSRLVQAILLDLLTHQSSLAQVAKAQQVYRERTARLADALSQRDVQVPGRDGLNVWIPVADEAAALLNLAGHGIRAAAGSPFFIAADSDPRIRITTAAIHDEFDALADAIASAAHTRAWGGPG